MARSVTEIYNTIIVDKNNNIPSLDSTSQTAIWRVWAYITSLAHHLLERIVDVQKAEIVTLISSQKVHTGKWYQKKALEFQYDATTEQILTVDDYFNVSYQTPDTTKRIITRASIREASRKLYVKINKGTVPNLAVLSELEIASFTSYINLMKDAGTQIIVQSFPVEKLIVKCEVDYSPAQGVVTSIDVKNMIDDYLANLDFDGVVNVQALEARILSDARVRNMKLIYLLATQNNDTPIGEFYNLPIGLNDKIYKTVSGHIILNREVSEVIINAV